MQHIELEAFCPFCLQTFESAEQRTLHLIFDRCERRFLTTEEPAFPRLPQAAASVARHAS